MPQVRRSLVAGNRARAVTAALAAALLVGACGAAAAPSPSPSPSPTPSPTPSPSPTASPTPTPTPNPSPSAAADPAIGLTIDPPYELTEFDAATSAAMQSQMQAGMGAMASLVSVGVRQVWKAGVPEGAVVVMSFPTGLLNDAAYQGAVAGVGSSMGVTFETRTISGVEASVGSSATAGIGVFRTGDHLVMVITPPGDAVVPISTALISANS